MSSLELRKKKEYALSVEKFAKSNLIRQIMKCPSHVNMMMLRKRLKVLLKSEMTREFYSIQRVKLSKPLSTATIEHDMVVTQTRKHLLILKDKRRKRPTRAFTRPLTKSVP